MSLTSFAPATNLLWKYLESENIDPAPIYKKAGIKPELLQSENARIKIDLSNQLWSLASTKLNNPCFAIKMVKFWHPSMMGALGYAWLASSSLRSAFNRVQRYSHVVSEQLNMHVTDTPQGLKICLNLEDSSSVLPQRHDLTIAMLMHLCRINFGNKLVPTEVKLAHPQPKCSQLLDDYFRIDIQFDADQSSLTIARKDVDTILNPENNQISLLHDDVLMKYLIKVQNGDIVQQVQTIIIDNLPDGHLTNSIVANKMNMSDRSLQRRLNEHGTTFRKILDGVREMVAIQYIKNPATRMNEIAFLLGFSEQSAFSRAFKKWTGMPPIKYRQNFIAIENSA